MIALLARLDDFLFRKFKAHHIKQQEQTAQTFNATAAPCGTVTNDELLEHYNYLITEVADIKVLLNDLIKHLVSVTYNGASDTITTAAVPTRDTIKAWLLEHIDSHDLEDLREHWSFSSDIGLDSLDLTALLLAVEDHYNIQITNELAVQVETIGQAIDLIIATISTDTKTPSA